MPQAREFPKGVPGQRLRLDTESRTAAVLEPLHEAQHAVTRERIEKKGMTIGPASEEVGNVDVPTWAYWLKRAVEGGLAKVVRGSLPPIEGKPRKQFMTAERVDPADEDRLVRRQEVAAKLAMMTPAQRKEYDRILAEQYEVLPDVVQSFTRPRR